MKRIWLDRYPPGMPAEVDVAGAPPLDVFLNDRVTRYADRPAFSSFGTQITYREFDEAARNLAAFLQNEIGLRKGDRIAVMLPNLIQQPVAVYAALRLGLVVVNINPLYTPRELKHQLNDADTATIVIWANVLPVLTEIIGDTGIRNVIVAQTGDMVAAPIPATPVDSLPVKCIAFAGALERGRDLDLTPAQCAPDDLAFLQYTGGTTGLSKGAMLTHHNLSVNVSQTRAPLKDPDEGTTDIFITALPLYHIFALTANFLLCAELGGLNVLITNPRDMPAFVDELRKWKFTGITGVNTLYNGLLNTPGFDELDFSVLRIAIAGGMALQSSVAKRWHSVTGVEIHEGYGLSETSPVLTVNPAELPVRSGSIGLPVPSTDIAICDDEGNEVPHGESGELCARGPQVMSGYWRNEAATRQVMTKDDFFRTGDIARMDEEGFFYIIDRKKDMILVSGFNVYPNEVEEVAASMDGILECACVGVPDEKTSEAVVLYVVPGGDSPPQPDAINAWCRKHLAAYKIPSRIHFVDELPKTTVGKILRRELRDRAATTGA